MPEQIPIVNRSMELAEYRDQWTYNDKYGCWCLEDVLYTPKAKVPKFQRLSVFVPRAYLNADGTVNEAGRSGRYTARTVPVVFENNSAGYAQMPHTWLDGPRCCAAQYLERGFVYVTCGCRGRDSRDEAGRPAGKAPIAVVDLKTAIRFLRHNREALPGDWDRLVSVGWSAGGAMSSLLAVSGDHAAFGSYLEENGAFMEESDSVFAAQIYCPIVDLEHADLAYEWMFRADKTSEDSPAGPAETMTAFKEALSEALCRRYIAYFNGLELRDPDSGGALTLDPGGRGGTGCDYLMARLEESATDYLSRLAEGKLPQTWSVRDYLAGNYTFEAIGPRRPMPEGDGNGPDGRVTMGDLMSRPPKGAAYQAFEPPVVTVRGRCKEDWLSWDGSRAHITSLDDYVLRHRGRMKSCPAFDTLEMSSGENEEFGTEAEEYVHFDPAVADALEELRERFPAEYEQYHGAFSAAGRDSELARRVSLMNPLDYIGAENGSRQARHYRIRVGACDADTALSVSMTLAVKLANAGCGTVDYALVWDQPHCEADYPGEVCDWIDRVCGQGDEGKRPS